MCWIAAAAQGIMGVASSVIGYNAQVEQAKAEGEATVRNAKNATLAMNREFANFEMERRDAYDKAVAEIAAVRQNADQLQSSVDAALGEE